MKKIIPLIFLAFLLISSVSASPTCKIEIQNRTYNSTQLEFIITTLIEKVNQLENRTDLIPASVHNQIIEQKNQEIANLNKKIKQFSVAFILGIILWVILLRKKAKNERRH